MPVGIFTWALSPALSLMHPSHVLLGPVERTRPGCREDFGVLHKALGGRTLPTAAPTSLSGWILSDTSSQQSSGPCFCGDAVSEPWFPILASLAGRAESIICLGFCLPLGTGCKVSRILLPVAVPALGSLPGLHAPLTALLSHRPSWGRGGHLALHRVHGWPSPSICLA